MKTATEWKKEYWNVPEVEKDRWVKIVNQIQLEAMKEGMRRAADVAEQIRVSTEKYYGVSESVGANKAKRAILTTAEQLTIKDL